MEAEYRKYCDQCERTTRLTEDGYCRGCGKHADNMPDDRERPTGSDRETIQHHHS